MCGLALGAGPAGGAEGRCVQNNVRGGAMAAVARVG